MSTKMTRLRAAIATKHRMYPDADLTEDRRTLRAEVLAMRIREALADDLPPNAAQRAELAEILLDGAK